MTSRVPLGPIDGNRRRARAESSDGLQAGHSKRVAIQISSSPEPEPSPTPPGDAWLSSEKSKEAVQHSFSVSAHLLGLVRGLHASRPTHPMFGEPAVDLLRLPLVSRRRNGQSWESVCHNIDGWVALGMGVGCATIDACWMSGRDYRISIRKSTNGVSVICKTIVAARWIYFLSNPSDENWDKLSNGNTHHFSHFCGRGEVRADDQVGRCLNGVTHGRFETRVVNEDRKKCTNGARALCPGHGEPAVKCIFARPDGQLAPCLMMEDRVGPCTCESSCLPRPS